MAIKKKYMELRDKIDGAKGMQVIYKPDTISLIMEIF